MPNPAKLDLPHLLRGLRRRSRPLQSIWRPQPLPHTSPTTRTPFCAGGLRSTVQDAADGDGPARGSSDEVGEVAEFSPGERAELCTGVSGSFGLPAACDLMLLSPQHMQCNCAADALWLCCTLSPASTCLTGLQAAARERSGPLPLPALYSRSFVKLSCTHV